jgi:transcriptional regulator with XRE-family HTH domain
LVDTMPNPNSRTEIGARLVLTRKALDYTQATMAGLMGVDGQTLAAYEAGRRRIPMKQALKLCPYGIPLDWIYQGQMDNLHPHIRAKILEQAPQS